MNSLERIIDWNVEDYNKSWEIYEVGVYKTWADNTKQTKSLNWV